MPSIQFTPPSLSTINGHLSDRNLPEITAQMQADKSLRSFTSVGCYPLMYVTDHDAVVCPDCAYAIVAAKVSGDDLEYLGHDIAAYDSNWQDPELYCDQCETRIESAYAEDRATVPLA